MDRQTKAVKLDDCRHQVEAEPKSRCAPQFFRSIEPLQDGITFGLADSRAGVLDADDAFGIAAQQRDFHPASGRCTFDRVVDEVDDGLDQQVNFDRLVNVATEYVATGSGIVRSRELARLVAAICTCPSYPSALHGTIEPEIGRRPDEIARHPGPIGAKQSSELDPARILAQMIAGTRRCGTSRPPMPRHASRPAHPVP